MATPHKIGIDVGGTKIAAILFDPHDTMVTEKRISAPRNDYDKTIRSIVGLISDLELNLDQKAHVGVGIPGSISPETHLVQNANSTWLNGKPLYQDLSRVLERDIRIENDANCFALSEALMGAGRGARMVFGVILGTGCGGGLVFDGKLLSGPHAIGGEWGHNPLPWPTAQELGAVECWCGKKDCIESWVSGPAMSADHFRVHDEDLSAEHIVQNAIEGNQAACDTLEHYLSRLARGLAAMTNIIDPDVIVLGGGLSNIDLIYERLPEMMVPYIFADHFKPCILKPEFGDASGVRGAAHLWP